MAGSGNRDRPVRTLAARTQAIYDRNAGRFDAERSRSLVEKPWLDRFLSGLPAAATILDLGCGTGDPIAAYMRGRGFPVTGVDSSLPMLEIARRRFPGGDWRHADMRGLDLGRTFHGIVGWDSFFHLVPDEQRATIPRLAAHLKPGGMLMLTVGPAAGEVAGSVGDEPVYHASLARDDYEDCLTACGLGLVSLVAEDPDCDFHTVLLARKSA